MFLNIQVFKGIFEGIGGSFFEPLTTSVAPAFFHPFAIDCLPSDLEKWLYIMITIQVS